MLIIKQSQIEQLGAHLRDRFVRAMSAHVRSNFADRFAILGEEAVGRLIIEGITKAATFGIVSERDCGGLIHFMFATQPDFDQRPEFQWAVDALRTPGFEPTELVDLLYTRWGDHRPAGGRS